VQVWRSA